MTDLFLKYKWWVLGFVVLGAGAYLYFSGKLGKMFNKEEEETDEVTDAVTEGFAASPSKKKTLLALRN